MKKDNFYKIIIVFLLLLNIGILSFLWFGHSGIHERHGGPDKIIVERLRLDEKQQEQFETLKKEHHLQMIKIQETNGKLHDAFFQLLQNEPVDTIAENVILKQIEENDAQKEQVTFEHFRKLRAILRPEQKPLFDNFVSELSRQIMGPPQLAPDGHPPDDGPPGRRP